MAISRHKNLVFPAVGALLLFNYWVAVVRPKAAHCAPGEACHVDSPAMRLNRRLFWLSVAIYAIAVIITYSALWWVRMQS
jgi:hypothetical protein